MRKIISHGRYKFIRELEKRRIMKNRGMFICNICAALGENPETEYTYSELEEHKLLAHRQSKSTTRREEGITTIQHDTGENLKISISGATGIEQKDYVELAANLMGLAHEHMRKDLIRIAAQEFDYIVRRRREIAVQTTTNQNILEFIKRKQAALEAGEFVVDTITGQLTFLDKELQPWL